mmetsp:Transcript_68310/g.216130  ORF Transcript_68310/g.216130 Transcript_68310/m.216130 type:complete len:228 (-) Transcript_68310:45-728(-)
MKVEGLVLVVEVTAGVLHHAHAAQSIFHDPHRGPAPVECESHPKHSRLDAIGRVRVPCCDAAVAPHDADHDQGDVAKKEELVERREQKVDAGLQDTVRPESPWEVRSAVLWHLLVKKNEHEHEVAVQHRQLVHGLASVVEGHVEEERSYPHAGEHQVRHQPPRLPRCLEPRVADAEQRDDREGDAAHRVVEFRDEGMLHEVGLAPVYVRRPDEPPPDLFKGHHRTVP